MGEDVVEIRTSDGDDLLITAFWGGRERGRCYQFTVHGPTGLSESRERTLANTVLTENQVIGLVEALGGHVMARPRFGRGGGWGTYDRDGLPPDARLRLQVAA